MLLALMMACDPLGPGPFDPDAPSPQGSGLLAVEPTRLEFGDFDCLEDAPQIKSFTVINRGGGELVVAGLNLIVGSEAFTTDAPALLRVEPGERFTVNVRFDPISDGPHEAQLVPNGAVQIQLEGEAHAPRARLLSEALDLGATRVGCFGTAETLLLNEGSLPMSIDGVTLNGSSAFTLLTPLPAELDPGEQAPVRLRFTPLDGGEHQASLSFTTNDPADATTSLSLSGLGVPGGRVVESFPYEPIVAADLLFVVDASASFDAQLASAQADAAQLFAALDLRGVDWHVAITNPATDCNSSVSPYLSTATFSRYSAEQAGSAFAVGLDPLSTSFEPTLLEHAAAVLERTGPLECLDGFLRPGAQLHVVVVTGRADRSPNEPEEYVESMRRRVSRADHLVVSAVSGDGNACADGGAARDAAMMTGGLLLDPCALSWPTIYESLAEVAVDNTASQATFVLAETPVPDTIVVRHDSAVLTAWTYDASSNSLVIEGSQNGLSPGDPLEIEYLEAIACEG